jgi:hypothetical protein
MIQSTPAVVCLNERHGVLVAPPARGVTADFGAPARLNNAIASASEAIQNVAAAAV